MPLSENISVEIVKRDCNFCLRHVATSNQSELLDPGLANWLDPLVSVSVARLRLIDNSACLDNARNFERRISMDVGG